MPDSVDPLDAMAAARAAAAAVPLEQQLAGLCADLAAAQRVCDRIHALPDDYVDKAMLVQVATTLPQLAATQRIRLAQLRQGAVAPAG